MNRSTELAVLVQAAFLELTTASAWTRGVAAKRWSRAGELPFKLSRSREQVLVEDPLERGVEMRVLALHHRRTLEEVLRGDGKELRLVGEGVTVDVRSPAFDLGHLAAHEVNPRPDGLTIESHTWHPVDGTVGLVDMGVCP